MTIHESNLKKWIFRSLMTFPAFFVLISGVAITKAVSQHPIDWVTVGNSIAFGLVWLLILGIFIGRNPNWLQRNITKKTINLAIALFIVIELAIWLVSKFG